MEEEGGHEAEKGEGNEEGEKEVIEEAEVGELSEVAEEERKDGDIDGECEANRRAESGGEEVDDLRGDGEADAFGGGPFGKKGAKGLIDGRIEEEDSDGAAKAELEAEIGGDEGIENEFEEERGAEEIDGAGLSTEEFGEKEERGGEPGALNGGRRADEKIVERGEEEKGDPFGADRKKEGEERGEKGHEKTEVKPGDGENVLQTEAAKFKAEEPIFYFAGRKRGEEGGDAGREFGVEKGAELFFGLVAELCEAKGVSNGAPLFHFEGVIVSVALLERADEEVVGRGGGAIFGREVDGAGEISLFVVESAPHLKVFMERGLVGLE